MLGSLLNARALGFTIALFVCKLMSHGEEAGGLIRVIRSYQSIYWGIGPVLVQVVVLLRALCFYAYPNLFSYPASGGSGIRWIIRNLW